MQEIWKDIEGYNGYHQISNYGRVKSCDRISNNRRGNYLKKSKILKTSVDNDGYIHVTLCKNGERKTFTIHKLVATSFIENPFNLLEINHKDENKANNNVENLEWCTRKYNLNYGNRMKKIRKCVVQYYNEVEVCSFNSIMDAENKTSINKGSISNCCLGKTKTAGGFNWKYV